MKPLCLCWNDSCLGKDRGCFGFSAVKLSFTAAVAAALEVLRCHTSTATLSISGGDLR